MIYIPVPGSPFSRADIRRFADRTKVRLTRWVAAARTLELRRPEFRLDRRWAVAGGMAGGVVALGLVALAADVLIGTPGPDQIRGISRMPLATTVYDRQDQPAFTIFEERRIEVPLGRVSAHAVQAVLAIEDQRFYRHRGIDLWRVGGAVVANLRRGERAQGGSTITQQLARLSFLSREKSLRRKLKEMFLAIRVERQFSKDQILELYLNKVYFGAGFYGIEAAARGYFGKPAADLTVEEAALLAGLIQAPSAYAPTEHLDRAVARRAVVLRQMVEAGFLDRSALPALTAAPVSLENGFGDERMGAYFKQAVTRRLVERFGWELVSKGGLRVYTTFDAAMQQAAEDAIGRGLDAAEEHPAFRHPRRGEAGVPGDYLQGALVALDSATGEVRALVGGRDFNDSQFDRATQARRQAGSAFKPFVYAAALEMGYTPATLVTGLDEPMDTPEGEWVPEDGHADAVSMTVRTALRTSSNRAAVQVLRAVGIPEAVRYSERLGVHAPAVPSLVLGSGDVTPLSLTAAFGVFAAGGWFRPPVMIRRVEDAQGNVLLDERPEPSRVISDETAFQMAQLLADVVDRGTGYRVRQTGFRLPAAGKTGTTNEYHDAWFVGFTPDVVAGVWVGFDQPRPIMRNGYASELAAPIWGRFMREVAGRSSGRWLERPDDVVAVEICRESGLRPGAGCSRVARVNQDGETSWGSAVGIEFFRRGTEPVTECPLHDSALFPGALRTAVVDAASGDSLPALQGVATIGSLPGRPAELSVPPPRAEEDEDKDEKDKKKGFWSRFFGVFKGGGDDKDDKKDDDKNGAGRDGKEDGKKKPTKKPDGGQG